MGGGWQGGGGRGQAGLPGSRLFFRAVDGRLGLWSAAGVVPVSSPLLSALYREDLFNAIQTYTNPFNAIRFYSFPSIPSNLNSNPLNAIAVSFKLTLLVLFKTNLFNAIKIYINPSLQCH
jgi:hypothetical protein